MPFLFTAIFRHHRLCIEHSFRYNLPTGLVGILSLVRHLLHISLITDRYFVCPLNACGAPKNILIAFIDSPEVHDASWVRNISCLDSRWLMTRFRKSAVFSATAIHGQFVGCVARGAALAILPVPDLDVERAQDGNLGTHDRDAALGSRPDEHWHGII